jgi:ABC-type nitrate/sulfonate/bicarbonate transport system substrate-binding protein
MYARRFLALLLTLVLLALLTASALAQETVKRVALVIQLPDYVYSEIVTVPADATTADVLEAAVIPVGMATFSWGTAICNIGGVGNPVDDCFADPQHFWAYYHLEGNSWVPSDVGVSNFVPADQAVEGFAWSGFDANYNPTVQPPVMTFEEVEAGQFVPIFFPSIRR